MNILILFHFQKQPFCKLHLHNNSKWPIQFSFHLGKFGAPIKVATGHVPPPLLLPSYATAPPWIFFFTASQKHLWPSYYWCSLLSTSQFIYLYHILQAIHNLLRMYWTNFILFHKIWSTASCQEPVMLHAKKLGKSLLCHCCHCPKNPGRQKKFIKSQNLAWKRM